MIKISYGRDSVCMGDDQNNSTYEIKMPGSAMLGDFIRVLYEGGWGNDWPIPLSHGVNWTVKSNIGDIATICGMHEKIIYHAYTKSMPLSALSITSVFCESKLAEVEEPEKKTPPKERWGLPEIDQDCMAVVEEKAEAIREKALEIIRQEMPDIQFVVDPYILDDYYSGQIDKPGIIYPQFCLPHGKTEQEIIEDIVNNTREYYGKNGN
ncbi:MAG: hypothetical protein Q4B67_04995 [Eubacteriales bacterium]|nr:hypothetical protein [Eubacteriales bacterium]